VLRRAQRLGFLGPGAVEAHIEHAGVFREVDTAPDRALDLGSGGGVPGLILALGSPATAWTLLDAGERRARFLEEAVAELGLAERVTVLRERAERAGHGDDLRARFDLVVARAFGPPAVTAECGSPFLRPDGRLVVSEPPESGNRWDASGLDLLGLALGPRLTTDGGSAQVLEQRRPCPDRFARRPGIPAKRPLW
jgi:16S rRNA (guanine527-N7)-methyltransferase